MCRSCEQGGGSCAGHVHKEVGSCAGHVGKEVRSWYTHMQPSKHVKGTNDGCTRCKQQLFTSHF